MPTRYRSRRMPNDQLDRGRISRYVDEAREGTRQARDCPWIRLIGLNASRDPTDMSAYDTSRQCRTMVAKRSYQSVKILPNTPTPMPHLAADQYDNDRRADSLCMKHLSFESTLYQMASGRDLAKRDQETTIIPLAVPQSKRVPMSHLGCFRCSHHTRMTISTFTHTFIIHTIDNDVYKNENDAPLFAFTVHSCPPSTAKPTTALEHRQLVSHSEPGTDPVPDHSHAK
jgi:hypothetical protein